MEAPKTLKDTSSDLAGFQQLLNSLKGKPKDTSDDALSAGLKKFLEDIKPSLGGCAKAFVEFKAKLAKIGSHSIEEHTSKRTKSSCSSRARKC